MLHLLFLSMLIGSSSIVNSLNAMENWVVDSVYKSHPDEQHKNPIISNEVKIHNKTNRELIILVISNGILQQWKKEGTTPEGNTPEGNTILEITPADLEKIEKKKLIGAGKQETTCFAKFLRYPYTITIDQGKNFTLSDLSRGYQECDKFFEEQENKILILDHKNSNFSYLFRAASTDDIGGEGSSHLSTIRTNSEGKEDGKQLTKYPENFSNIQFTLNLADGPNNKLEESGFIATIVE